MKVEKLIAIKVTDETRKSLFGIGTGEFILIDTIGWFHLDEEQGSMSKVGKGLAKELNADIYSTNGIYKQLSLF